MNSTDEPKFLYVLSSPAKRGEYVGLRLLALHAGFDADSLEPGELTEAQLSKIEAARTRLEGIALYIDDDARLSLQGLRYRCRRLKEGFDLGFVVVDEVGLIARQTEAPAQLPAETGEGMKGLAGELDVPVVVTLGLPPGCTPTDLFGVPDFRGFIGAVDTVLVVENGDDQMRVVHNRRGDCGTIAVPVRAPADGEAEGDLLDF